MSDIGLAWSKTDFEVCLPIVEFHVHKSKGELRIDLAAIFWIFTKDRVHGWRLVYLVSSIEAFKLVRLTVLLSFLEQLVVSQLRCERHTIMAADTYPSTPLDLSE